MIQVVKILNILFAIENGNPETINAIPDHLFNTLVSFIKNNDVNENLFCNTCNLYGILIDKKDKNELTEKVY